MASTLQQANISQLTQATNQLTTQVQDQFGRLTATQINWKPTPTEWSIGQCIDHLIVTNTLYFSIFQQILDGTQQPTFWTRLPGWPTLCAKLFIKVLDPDNQRRVSAPNMLLPTSSALGTGIFGQFANQQAQLIHWMQATAQLPIDRLIITSLIAAPVTYSVLDAYRIIVIHEQRHLRQMQQVLQMMAFPNAVT